ncbi:MAG: LysE family translocator [Synergistales bacterium]|nr:LysE family translocator [Synergistales bacterium]
MIFSNMGFLFLKGALMGFSIAAPVGPIGVLCIRRTLSHGMLNGIVSGLGAATADGCYGVIAAAGLTSLSSLLIYHQLMLKLAGGAFLLCLGIKTLFSRPASTVQEDKRPQPGELLKAYSSIFALTITNPMTIISFTAIFAGLGIGSSAGSPGEAMVMVGGVFSGSAAWWLILGSIFGFVRTRVNQGMMVWVNRLSGVVISAFGVVAIISVNIM